MQLEKGMKISCNIGGFDIDEAIVQEEGGILYICQNFREGYDCYNKLGFEHSWSVNSGSVEDCERESVFGIKLIDADNVSSPEGVDIEQSDILKEGMIIKCTIGKRPVNKAIVHREGSIFYLCQNIACGSECEDRKGYKYSWLIGPTPNRNDVARYDVSDIIILGEYNLNLRLVE